MIGAYRTRYAGPLKAAILDWSGTTIDYGSIAPVKVFVGVFKHFGIEVSTAEARLPMGKYKRDHLKQMLEMPRIAALWQNVHGQAPCECDVDKLYAAFMPIQREVVPQYSELIPGVKETIEVLRERGLKIGSCTGYTREMVEPLLPLVAEQGYTPDALVCPDEVGAGRPEPWMCLENVRRLGVYPVCSVVKIGDTVSDIEEGLNAGMWTIGLAVSGNEVGLALADWQSLEAMNREQLRAKAYRRLHQAGAHYVVDSLSDVPEVLDLLCEAIRKGERP